MSLLYDAHQHFHFAPLEPHRAAVVRDLHGIGLQRAVVNATNEAEWPVVAALAQEFAWVVPSHGVHPWDVGDASSGWLDRLRMTLNADPSAAVGEIGLDRWIIDGVRPDDPRLDGIRVASMVEQTEAFAGQLTLAAELNRAASIHCVQAFGALAEILRQISRPARGFLLHGYGGPVEMVRTFVDLGAYFSYNVEFEGARHAARRETFKHIPLERLLVETDAPTKAPPPELNRYPLPGQADDRDINHPANLIVTYEALAKIRGLSVEALAAAVEQNFRRLFL